MIFTLPAFHIFRNQKSAQNSDFYFLEIMALLPSDFPSFQNLESLSNPHSNFLTHFFCSEQKNSLPLKTFLVESLLLHQKGKKQ